MTFTITTNNKVANSLAQKFPKRLPSQYEGATADDAAESFSYQLQRFLQDLGDSGVYNFKLAVKDQQGKVQNFKTEVSYVHNNVEEVTA